MYISDISTKITNLTGASTTDYTNANRLIDVNIWYDKIWNTILEAQDEWDIDDSNNSDFPIATTSLVANQQDYALPTNLINIKRAEITFDGTNWYKISPFDINERGNVNTTTQITNDFPVSDPYYDIIANSILIYPIPTANSTNGLKLWYDRQPTAFTSTDWNTNPTAVKPGFDSNFHYLLAYGAAIEFLRSNGMHDKADRYEQYVMNDLEKLKKYYGDKQQDRILDFKSDRGLENYE